MQTDLRNCLFCNEEFHPFNNIPRILPTCGHTFCSQCLGVILANGKCPLDSISAPYNFRVDQIPINSAVLATLQSFCQRHHKPDDLICLREYKRICDDCKEECLYQRHNIKALSDIEAETEQKKEYLKAITEEFESEYEEIDTLLNEKEEALIEEVNNTFEAFKEEIEKTKKEIHNSVRRFFEEQKKIADESYNHDDQLKNQANDLLQTLKEKAMDQGFFKALYTHVGRLTISSQKPQIDSTINTVENHIGVIEVELKAVLERIPTLFKTNNTDDFKVEESGEDSSDISAPLLLFRNHDIAVIQEIPPPAQQEQEQPRIEEEATEEDFQKVISLWNAEIEEESNRLILSFKSQKEDMETEEEESILNNQENLQTIHKVKLNINKNPLWKEAIQSLKWIWNKLNKVLDFKIDFSYKSHAKDILKALVHQSQIWATSDLLEFTIDLSESQVKDKSVTQLYEKAISKMSQLQKLEIVLEKTKITDKSIKKFAENTLPNLINLTDFRFYVDNTKATDEALQRLLGSLSGLKKNLTGIAFGFDETAITDKTFQNIAESISPLATTLTKLDLSANNANISDEGLKIFSEAFDSKLIKLQELTLDLGRTKVSNEGLKFFMQSTLSKMASLEVFELFLNEQKKITNKLIKPIAKSLQSLNNLKKICLELGASDISGKTLDALEKYALKNKPALEIFELYVAESSKIKDVDINNFFMKIEKEQTFKNLHTLSFCFSKLHVTDDGCELIAKSIQSCEKLQVLKLQLGKTKVTDTGLDHLSNGIYQVLQRTKLTEFQLYLDSTLVTDKGLKVFLNQVVRNLVGLKSFELYLTRVQGVTDQGVEILFAALATVAGSLKNLDISLYETRITDSCMKALSNTLWNVKPNLESFALSVGKNKNITDMGLGWCLENFRGVLKGLKKLTLGIEETKIGQKGLGILKNYLKGNNNALENIEIEVGDDKGLEKIVKDLNQSILT